MAGPALAPSPAKPASPPEAKPSGVSPGRSPPANMNRTVVNVAARRQELLDKEVSATSWKVLTHATLSPCANHCAAGTEMNRTTAS